MLLASLLLISLSGCTDPLDQFAWLEGTWAKEGESVEIWKRQPDGSYLGKGGSIEAGDTVYFETLEIRIQEGDIYYLPDVDHNQGPVPFKLTHHDLNTWTFENPEHDFPTLIRYTFEPPNLLKAAIEGPGEVAGDTKAIDFWFEKVEDE